MAAGAGVVVVLLQRWLAVVLVLFVLCFCDIVGIVYSCWKDEATSGNMARRERR